MKNIVPDTVKDFLAPIRFRGHAKMLLWLGLALPALSGCTLADPPTSGSSSALPATARSNPAPSAAWVDPSYGAWHSCVMGGGGFLLNTMIAPSNPKRIYVHGDMDGLFRSDDGGNSWRMIHGGLDVKDGHYEYAGVAVDPHDPDKVAIAFGSKEGSQQGIFISADAGNTWTKTLNVRFLGNGPFSWAGTRIAGVQSGLMVTASEGTGVWRSENEGRTWQDCGLHNIYFTDVYFDRTNAKRIWLCAAPVQLDSSPSGKLAGGEYRSDDSGKTWTKLTDDAPFEIVQDPMNAHVLYGLCDTTVKRSLDLGATWQDFSDGLSPPSAHSGGAPFRAIGMGPDFTLVVQSDMRMIYRLSSGQSRWQKIEPVYKLAGWRFGFHAPPATDASSISVSPLDHNHWYLTDEFGFYQSWDAGKTWTPSNHGIETTVIHTIVQDPSNLSHAYLGAGDVGFWWSDDAGRVMNQTNSSSAGWVGNIKCIDASAKMPSRVYAVGGVGWKSDRVYVSKDGGRSVSLLTMQGTGLPDEPFACNSIVVDPNDPDSVYLATSAVIGAAVGGIYHSTDGGKSWAWMGQGLPLGKAVFQENIWWGGRELAMGPDGTLLAISANCGSAYRFDKSRGMWLAVSLPAVGGIYSVVADLQTPGRFYVCEVGNETQPGSTDGGLFRTDDSGTSWKQLRTGSTHAVVVDRGVKNRIAASTGQGVLLSADGGNAWTILEKLPNRGYYDSLAFAGNRLLAGTGGNGAFWIDLQSSKPAPVALSAKNPVH